MTVMTIGDDPIANGKTWCLGYDNIETHMGIHSSNPRTIPNCTSGLKTFEITIDINIEMPSQPGRIVVNCHPTSGKPCKNWISAGNQGLSGGKPPFKSSVNFKSNLTTVIPRDETIKKTIPNCVTLYKIKDENTNFGWQEIARNLPRNESND
jgi:hypothetical protein